MAREPSHCCRVSATATVYDGIIKMERLQIHVGAYLRYFDSTLQPEMAPRVVHNLRDMAQKEKGVGRRRCREPNSGTISLLQSSCDDQLKVERVQGQLLAFQWTGWKGPEVSPLLYSFVKWLLQVTTKRGAGAAGSVQWDGSVCLT